MTNTSMPSICTSGRQLRDIVYETLYALENANQPPRIFQRGGALVRVREDLNVPYIEALTTTTLIHRMNECADFIKSAAAPTAANPPEQVAKDILAHGSWSFPTLAGITTVPTFKPSGRILSLAGYDKETGLMYVQDPHLRVPTIPKNPNAHQVSIAVRTLLEVIEGFPFDSEASRTNALAYLLTTIIRPAVSGPVPLAVIEAPSAGHGKSLLTDVASTIMTGDRGSKMTAPQDSEEWRRQITSKLRLAPIHITIDNVTKVLDSAELAAVLTTSTWEDRQLGTNQMLQLPNRATWAVTGNNIKIGGDIPRRCYLIRIDSGLPRPWERTNFKRPDLVSWTKQNRGKLIAAALTLARSWHNAGRPGPDSGTLGSFESWYETAGGILAHAGQPSFMANKERIHQRADVEGPAWARFLDWIYKTVGDQPFSSKELAKRMEEASKGELVLPSKLGSIESSGFTRALGNGFRDKDGVNFGGWMIARAGEDPHLKVQLWRVLRVTSSL